MIPLWIIGAGGHAKVVIDAARASGMFAVMGCLDDRAEMIGTTILGVPIAGPVSESSVVKHDIHHAIIAIGDNAIRQQIAARLAHVITWATIVHPFTSVSPTASIGAGSLIAAGTVVQADSIIGEHVILNTSSSVDHDSRIADFVHIGPGAHLAGNVYVEKGAFLGLGTSVIPARTIGAWSVVGAGSVVVRDVPAHVTVAGVPARAIDHRE